MAFEVLKRINLLLNENITSKENAEEEKFDQPTKISVRIKRPTKIVPCEDRKNKIASLLEHICEYCETLM